MTQANQDGINMVPSEVKAQFSSFIEPFFSKYHRERCYPGLIFRQGKRTMLQINVPAADFPALLVAKPASDNDPDLGKQRPEVPGHADEIKKYIIENAQKGKPWILGTITANVDPSNITILEFGRGVCLTVIPRSVKLEITDGQHRKSAIQQLIESEESYLISDDDFPITLVLEKDLQQCQKDFRDMAQTKPLDRALLLSFGQFEGRVGITKNLVQTVPMFKDKTDKVHNSPRINKTFKFIYTNNYIARAVSCAFTNNPDDELRDYNVDVFSASLSKCLNQFFFECEKTRRICENRADALTLDDIKRFKDEYLLGMSVGLEVLGRLLYCTYDKERNNFDEVKVSQLAQIDWSRNNEIWKDNIVRINPNPEKSKKPYTLSTGATAVTDAVKMVKIKLGWI